MKTWVVAKEDLNLTLDKKTHKGIVPKGEIGFVKELPHIKMEHGAIQFPQTVFHFSGEKLSKLELPSVEDSISVLKEFEVISVPTKKGWFAFDFNIPKTLIPIGQSVTQFNKIMKEQVDSMVGKEFDDASLSNDFDWIKDWQWQNNKLMIQHKTMQSVDELVNQKSDDFIIDLSLDLQLINKKIKKSEEHIKEWLQTDEPWEEVE